MLQIHPLGALHGFDVVGGDVERPCERLALPAWDWLERDALSAGCGQLGVVPHGLTDPPGETVRAARDALLVRHVRAARQRQQLVVRPIRGNALGTHRRRR